jgi:hypothetical protein
MTPLAATDALEKYYLEARCRLLDLAAILDRIDRGGGLTNDPRLGRIREALTMLGSGSAGRAERVQSLFSLEYDPNWKRPLPR